MSFSFSGCNISSLFENENANAMISSPIHQRRQKFILKSSLSSSSDENSKKFQECFLNFKWTSQHRDAFQYCKHYLYVDN